MTTAGQQTFFQIAVGLIPVLLFGGILIDRVKRPPEVFTRRHRWIAKAIFITGLGALYAEIIAIDAAVTGDASTFDRNVVALAIVFGTLGLISAVVYPWMSRDTGSPIGAALLLVVGGAFLAWPTSQILTGSAGYAEFNKGSVELERALRRVYEHGRQVNRLAVQIAHTKTLHPNDARTRSYLRIRRRALRSEMKAERDFMKIELERLER